MTQEEKQLLLKDLCARLPYGVKCAFHSTNGDISSTIVKIDIENETVSHKPDGQNIVYFHWVESGYIKPYLRPMSSMTEEEYNNLCNSCTWLWFKDDLRTVTHGDYKCYDWLNSHHFDFRGLIEMGLALEAPEGMYKNE